MCRLHLASSTHTQLEGLDEKLEVVDRLNVLGVPLVRPDQREEVLKGLWEEHADDCARRVEMFAKLEEPQGVARCLELAGAWTRIQYQVALIYPKR